MYVLLSQYTKTHSELRGQGEAGRMQGMSELFTLSTNLKLEISCHKAIAYPYRNSKVVTCL